MFNVVEHGPVTDKPIHEVRTQITVDHDHGHSRPVMWCCSPTSRPRLAPRPPNSMAAVRRPRHTHKWLRACRPRPRGTAAIGCHRIITSHGSGGWLQSLCPSHSRWLKWLKWLSPSHLTQDGCDVASSAKRAHLEAGGMAAVVRLQPCLPRMAAVCVLQPSAWRLWLRCS